MRNNLTLVITGAAAVLLTLSSCSISLFCIRGEGSAETFPVSASGFTAIAAANHADVVLAQGSAYKVEVRAQQNVYDNMDVYVRDEVLHIENDRCVVQGPATVYVTMPSLETATTSGTGDIQIEGFSDVGDLELKVTGTGDIDLAGTAITAKGSAALAGDRFTFLISGTGDIVAEFDATEVDATLSGTGSMALSGSADSQDVILSGTGSYRAFELETTTAKVTLSGTGSADVNVTDALSGTLSGTGDITYRGNPAVDVTDSGTGDVQPE
ncbi:MAG: head GIN domain-containing protein [bacterium]